MLFLGCIVRSGLHNDSKYKEALKEIKHYLQCQAQSQQLHITETPHILRIKHNNSAVQLVKNCEFLHTCYYPIAAEDQQFLEVAYECLMVLRQYFPAKIGIQLITDGHLDTQSFQLAKKQEFSRRVGSLLKAETQSAAKLAIEDVENLLHLLSEVDSKKNKHMILRILSSNRINSKELSQLSQGAILVLEKVASEPDFKRIGTQLIDKVVQSARNKEAPSLTSPQFIKNKENISELSNSIQKSEIPLKFGTLLFQLRQSFNLQRICHILHSIVGTPHFMTMISAANQRKLDEAVEKISQQFGKSFYNEAETFEEELSELMTAYWKMRGQNEMGRMSPQRSYQNYARGEKWQLSS